VADAGRDCWSEARDVALPLRLHLTQFHTILGAPWSGERRDHRADVELDFRAVCDRSRFVAPQSLLPVVLLDGFDERFVPTGDPHVIEDASIDREESDRRPIFG